MATIKYEAIAKTGTYKDRQSGEEKTRFQKCGVVFESDKGLTLKLDALPIGFDGWLSLKEPKPRENNGEPSKPASAPAKSDLNDDIPF